MIGIWRVSPTGPGIVRADGDDVPVHERTGDVRAIGVGRSLQLQDPCGRQATQTRGSRAAGGSSEVRSPRNAVAPDLEEIVPRAALLDCLVEQARSQRRDHVRTGVLRTSRLAAERHVVGVAPEGSDVTLHPAQRRLLIEDAVISPGRPGVQCRMRNVAEQAQAIVDGHDDGGRAVGPARCELAAVVVVGLTVDVSAAVNPDDDRLATMVIAAGGPGREDVEIEAVLGDAGRTCEGTKLGHLRTGVRKLRGIQRASPPTCRRRRTPTQIADRRRCVGDAEEPIDAILSVSANCALVGVDHSPIAVVAMAMGIAMCNGQGWNGCDACHEQRAEDKLSTQ